MEVNIQNLIDDARCYEAVRDLRWSKKIQCAHCSSDNVIKRDRDDTSVISKGMSAKAVASDLMI